VFLQGVACVIFSDMDDTFVRVNSCSGRMKQARRSDWPDPEPSAGEVPLVDDITRLNADQVARVFNVRNVDDVQTVLRLARENKKTVSIRGTRHSMGGHTISPSGYVIGRPLPST